MGNEIYITHHAYERAQQRLQGLYDVLKKGDESFATWIHRSATEAIERGVPTGFYLQFSYFGAKWAFADDLRRQRYKLKTVTF